VTVDVPAVTPQPASPPTLLEKAATLLPRYAFVVDPTPDPEYGRRQVELDEEWSGVTDEDLHRALG